MKKIIALIKKEGVNVVTLFLSIGCGFLVAMLIFPWIYSLANFKDILGAIIGGAIAVFSSFGLLLLQNEIEKRQKDKKEREKLILFFNYYYSILDFTFTQAKEYLKEDDIPKMMKPDFDASAMGDLREKAFELLGLKAGRLSQVLYYLLINIGSKKNVVRELEMDMKLVPKLGSGAVRDALSKDLDEQYQKVTNFEKAFIKIAEEFKEKNRVGMSRLE